MSVKKVPYAYVRPTQSLNLLSHDEIEGVMNAGSHTNKLFRQCALAILNTDNNEDNALTVENNYKDFQIRIISESRGIKLEMVNAPASAFVDGKIIHGIREHLFSVLRDIVYTHHDMSSDSRFDFTTNSRITNSVFRILRNANIIKADIPPKLVICWGGHSIPQHEYDFTKHVGYELGLRGLDIGTGCGIGAMKGPMKGAVIGHGKQHIKEGRYIGITEPGIIASESPNPTVNELVILPDIEKRLEAFVRLAHSIIVFPGGVGTVEEVLYILGLLMHPANQSLHLPLIFAASEKSAEYFDSLDKFIRCTLGDEAAQYYEVIIDDPALVGKRTQEGIEGIHRHRRKYKELYAYNWSLTIPDELQQPFTPSHENMLQLALHRKQENYLLAAQLRCAFSGIVAGNVKTQGIKHIEQYGVYELKGDTKIIQALDTLLVSFVKQGRMKLHGEYQPCYKLIS
ncbi:LOG family protein [Candidatus Endobugula sertula]|uniref:AMP nucleosidase n=1 Tax=Candidatus Endobugula sertula TaxID=62101 RepID=A0A1D2QLL1_9GAMM|nr:LOG family protein [Candidatus Endobugula sertula]